MPCLASCVIIPCDHVFPSGVGMREFEELRSKVSRLTTAITYYIINERKLGKNLLKTSTIQNFENLLANLPGSFTVSADLKGIVQSRVFMHIAWSYIYFD